MRMIAATAFVLVAAPASAQAVNYDANYARYRPGENALDAIKSTAFRACMRRSGGTTVDMRDCSAQEYERVDAQLNANYRRVMGRLPQSQQQLLRASQRRWLANRWNVCEDLPEYEGGTLDLIIRDGCTLNELIRRTLWLGRL